MKELLVIYVTALVLITNIYGSDLTVRSLTCNDIKNPLGLDESPFFSWILSSETNGQIQTAYQLQIARSLEQLDEHADFYDSQRVMSDNSVSVHADLPPLQSAMRYYWRVRVWDAENRLSEWSEPAWFETGLLNPSDWRAEWMSAPVLFDWQAVDGRRKQMPKDAPPERPEPAPLFRKTFMAEKKVRQVRAYISGLGYYEMYLNGKKVGDHLLDPAFTRYDKRVLYVTYDVTEMIRDGENAVGVMLGNGWYNLTSRGVWGFDYAGWRQPPTLLCQIKITYADGSDTLIVSDASWRCAPGPIVFNSIRRGEWYDARRELPGWHTADFDDRSWFSARIVRGPQGVLRSQLLPPVKIHHSFKPKTIAKIANGHYLVDFGQNMAGFVEMSVTGQAGDTVTMKYAEKIKNGRIDQSNIDGLVASTPFQTDRYILKGVGVERWHARFTYHGFQYVEVIGFPGSLKDNLVAHALGTSFPNSGSFTTSNKLLNQIQHNTLWSYRNNFVGYPTDCPQREKNGWTGDAQLAAEAGLFNFASATAYRKWLQDIADEQQPSGEIAAIIPTAGWGYYWGNGPAWDSAFILIPYYLYLYAGDARTIATHYDQMKRYVDFLTREKSKDGIVSWGLGDWCHEKTDTPAEITSTAYYFVDAKLISLYAQILGKTDDAQKYADLAEDIRVAFLEKFVDVEKGTVGNNSQTALSCALYQALIDRSRSSEILKSLIHTIAEKNNKLDFGILGAKYTLNALSEYGYAEVAYGLINHTDYPGWGHWIKRGATTLWEDWRGTSSLSHIMFGDVSAWFYKNILGIQADPAKPGFKHFYLRPFFPADLSWAKGSIESPYGHIKSEWQRDGGMVTYTLTVPVNCHATLEIPAAGPEAVSLCEDAADFLSNLGYKEGQQRYKVPSGEYCFMIQE
ncbi:family 78 glycoside hydrolase catalytic domain [candidate division KSB1 bacterium]|nr:family 78 glycoside hydrolase catalytic domain [candidate division KSB1 bacterium]